MMETIKKYKKEIGIGAAGIISGSVVTGGVNHFLNKRFKKRMEEENAQICLAQKQVQEKQKAKEEELNNKLEILKNANNGDAKAIIRELDRLNKKMDKITNSKK